MGNLIGEGLGQFMWLIVHFFGALIKGLFQLFGELKKDKWNGNGQEEK